MLSHLGLTDFGPIAQADFDFCPGVNVLVGENGTGKSLALRAAWLATDNQESLNSLAPDSSGVTRIGKMDPFFDISRKIELEFISFNLSNIIKESCNDLVINYKMIETGNQTYSILANADTGFTQNFNNAIPPNKFDVKKSQLLPASDTLLHSIGSLELLRKHRYFPTPSLLSLVTSLSIQPIHYEFLSEKIRPLVLSTEKQLSGNLPRFNAQNTLEWKNRPIHLMAEGHRKLAAAAMLLANESIQPGDTLLWDEPEANLNPKLLAFLADWLADLAAAGVQVILSTHSLFLLRAFEIARKTKPGLPVRFFALHHGPEGVLCESADDLLSVRHLSSLDAELKQEDEYLALP